MRDIPLIDYAKLDSASRDRLALAVAAQTTLERALEWGRQFRPPLVVESILTQDEYAHDVLVRYQGRYLVYDTSVP
jgi:hypothetical protein